jgi:hypothetical protein
MSAAKLYPVARRVNEVNGRVGEQYNNLVPTWTKAKKC